MVFALAVAELHVPAARSLKEKRRVVKALVDRIHGRYRVSIIESAHQDLHQRAQLALAAVHHSDGAMEELLAGIRRAIDEQQEAMLLDWQIRYVEGEA